MTSYDYHNFPESVSALPKAVQNEALEAVLELISQKNFKSFEVGGAHLYDRKGYLTADELGGWRNGSYGSADDDVVLSITIRLNASDAKELIATSHEAHEAEKLAVAQAEAADVDRQLAELQKRRGEIRDGFGV